MQRCNVSLMLLGILLPRLLLIHASWDSGTHSKMVDSVRIV